MEAVIRGLRRLMREQPWVLLGGLALLAPVIAVMGLSAAAILATIFVPLMVPLAVIAVVRLQFDSCAYERIHFV